MKKPSFLLTAVAAVALLLSSCQGTIISFSDTEVTFDGSGHVQTNVTYTWSTDTETFSTDGTYEDVQRGWDATSSSWKQASGDKGAYSYMPSTHMMTINYTQKWSGGIGGSYVDLTAASGAASKTTTYPIIIGSANEYQVYAGSGGNYTSISQTTNWDGSSIKETYTFIVASDLSTVTEARENDAYNTGGTLTGGFKSNDVLTTDNIFPSSVTSLDAAKGKVITIDYLKDVNTPYTWSSGTFTAGTVTTYNNGGTMSVSFASDGSYFIWAGDQLARHLASE
jgi:hypothetical protein